jgi:hypothetical protein
MSWIEMVELRNQPSRMDLSGWSAIISFEIIGELRE